MNQFAENLRQLRTDSGLRQAEFADSIGVHVTNLSKYERGKTLPSLEVAERMAQTLDVTLDELVHGPQEQRANAQISDQELLSLFSKAQQLNNDQKATVSELLSAFLFKAGIAKQLA